MQIRYLTHSMETAIFRTGSGSIPVQTALVPSSPRLSVSLHLQDAAAAAAEKNGWSSPRLSLNIRRSSSESDLIGSQFKSLNIIGSRSFPARIPEEGCHHARSRSLTSPQELGFPGGGMNKIRQTRGGGDGGGNENDGNRCRIGDYYRELLKLNPTNSLFLGNYGKYLHEVVGDMAGAEEYYSRAILSDPGDGAVLSAYGKLIWETQRDENRAKSYFHQALNTSPQDCMILGSYAHFLWDAEAEDEEEELEDKEVEEMERVNKVSVAGAMVEAF